MYPPTGPGTALTSLGVQGSFSGDWELDFTAIPTSLTAAATLALDPASNPVGSLVLDELVIVNTTSAAIVVTVENQAGTPAQLLDAFSVPANANGPYVLTFPKGLLMTGGIQWQAASAGLLGAMKGRHR